MNDLNRDETLLIERLRRLRRLRAMGAPPVLIDRDRVLVRRALRALEYEMPLEEPEELHRLGMLPLTEEQQAAADEAAREMLRQEGVDPDTLEET